jgi:hypothetical protein
LTDDEPTLCPRDTPTSADVISGSASNITNTLSRQRFDCVGSVVLVDAERHDVLSAAEFALERGAIILAIEMTDVSAVVPELDRLDTTDVYWAGDESDLGDLSRLLGRQVQATPVELGESSNNRLRADDIRALTALPVLSVDQVDTRPLFLVDSGDLVLGALVAPAVIQSGGRVDVVDPDAAAFEPDGEPSSVSLVGDQSPTELWQYDGLLTGRSVLGGGSQLFPDRRFIAFYGSPDSPSLGVLGESQGPEAALQAIQPWLEAYGQDGVKTLPAFEIIVTIATNEPGSDGDYSTELFLDQVRPWVDVAEELGVYVILDLQPGRSDFLRQAKVYEELLARPNVGLALDPEWRLYGQQRHLEQIGTVDGAEVEAVSQWLAELVRDEGLPQKLFIVHQFRPEMVTQPELISNPPELATVIHVDGQGSRALKLNTYAVLTGVDATQPFWFGWKNFFDEDDPLSTAEQTVELDPAPVVITYQ